MYKKGHKYITVFAFALFFGWILALPYEGPVMYGMTGETSLNGKVLNILTVLLHTIGLFSARYITKDVGSAKRFIIKILYLCLIGSLSIPFVEVKYWVIILPIISLFAGMFVTTYAYFIKANIDNRDRTKALADMLIYSNIVLVFAHIITNNINAMIAYIFIQIILITTIILVHNMPIDKNNNQKKHMNNISDKKSITNIYVVLSLFIFIITINSGIMFQVIYPYFNEYPMLVSIYTNIPYIVAIYCLARYFRQTNKAYMLYVGLALWGITFIAFAVLNKSHLSFVIICTLMLSACGIFDIFWWSILGNLFEYVDNPSSVFGLGLSMNVFGVWIGGLLGNYIIKSNGSKEIIAFVGFGIILLSMLIIIPLNKKLTVLLTNHEFLFNITNLSNQGKKDMRQDAEQLLTKRELEVFEHLKKGYTNRLICKKLFISNNTIKTHNRHIYKKLGVKNKKELIKKYSNQSVNTQ